MPQHDFTPHETPLDMAPMSRSLHSVVAELAIGAKSGVRATSLENIVNAMQFGAVETFVIGGVGLGAISFLNRPSLRFIEAVNLFAIELQCQGAEVELRMVDQWPVLHRGGQPSSPVASVMAAETAQ